MSDTKIEWATKVWNPVTGCSKVSAGCKNCYAETNAKRFWGKRKFTDVQCREDKLSDPLHWKKPQRIFVNSMSDLFHPDVPFEFIAKVFAIMFLCWKDDKKQNEQHQFLILTKRPERFEYLTTQDFFDLVSDYANDFYNEHVRGLSAPLFYSDEVASCFPLENVWLGVSVEDQKAADERIPLLMKTPAAVRFISAEPLIELVDLFALQPFALASDSKWWVICGGESGKNARPMHPDWARSLRDQCKSANVPFFFKQWGEWKPLDAWAPSDVRLHIKNKDDMKMYDENCNAVKVGKKKAGRLLDGIEHNEFPSVA